MTLATSTALEANRTADRGDERRQCCGVGDMHIAFRRSDVTERTQRLCRWSMMAKVAQNTLFFHFFRSFLTTFGEADFTILIFLSSVYSRTFFCHLVHS